MRLGSVWLCEDHRDRLFGQEWWKSKAWTLVRQPELHVSTARTVGGVSNGAENTSDAALPLLLDPDQLW